MKEHIFEFEQYKPYLRARLAHESPRSGLKSSLARAVGCHTTYLSQVFNSLADFNLEQAERLNVFLQHTEQEGDYFLILVSKSRAGTRELQAYFEKKRLHLLSERFNIQDRVKMNQTLTAEDRSQYYSQWYYAAIHVAVSVPDLQTKERLATHFGLPIQVVIETLNFLNSVGLVEENGVFYKIGSKQIHLGQKTQEIAQHHTHWRHQAITSMERKRDSDLHYSAAVTLSRHDVDKIKSKLMDTIQDTLRDIVASPEEEVYSYCIDFFNLKR